MKIHFFLLLRPALSTVFRDRKSVSSYIDTKGEAIQELPTHYNEVYLLKVAKRLEELLTQDFERQPASKPANLLLRKREKKYPLHTVDKNFNFSLFLTNNGTGKAYDVRLHIEVDDSIQLSDKDKQENFLGNIDAGSTAGDIEISCRVVEPSKSVLVIVTVFWYNFDKSHGSKTEEFNLEAQHENIDWESLQREDPYSLEPVSQQEDLIGRNKILNQLFSGTQSKILSSFFIYGQKRVGKTSVVKTFITQISGRNPDGLHTIYLEAGNFIEPDASKTIEHLGTLLCEEIKKLDPRLSNSNIPKFSSSLSPLSDFLKSAQKSVPDLKIVFIIDEFDELPAELFRLGEMSNAFFLTMRSISNIPAFSFILVGGEKMRFVLDKQAEKINKFERIILDYFDKERHWSDFQSLVRKPVERWLEIHDEAITYLYEQTAGNPFFTKLICRELFVIMRDRRDCSVSMKEVNDAVNIALKRVSSNFVQHFWKDAIWAPDTETEEQAMYTRKKVLLAFAESVRQFGNPSREQILEKVSSFDVSNLIAEKELNQFKERQILVDNDGIYKCKVAFFERWLKDVGMKEIITTSSTDYTLENKKAEEEARIRSEEIVNLATKWNGTYLGELITEDKIRAWLNQFGTSKNQRLMFKLLENLRFYSGVAIRSKIQEAHEIVTNKLVRKYESGKKKRQDILVSYLDGPGKSGAECARKYASHNEIYSDKIIEREKIPDFVKQNKELEAVVFIDDFIGTGQQAKEYFEKLASSCGDILRERKLLLFFIVISGFQSQADEIRETFLPKLSLPDVRIHLCDPLSDEDKCFSNKSKIFTDQNERESAMNLAQELGSKLEKKYPLGYGNCQATVVFEWGCPNNCLPILWKESQTWRPLFKRR